MYNKLKKLYLEEYQEIVYEIQVTKAEYEKSGAFVSIALLITANIKLYFNAPWWFLLVFILGMTIIAKFLGRYLIKIGVPKKTNELANSQNPQMVNPYRDIQRRCAIIRYFN